MVWVFLSLMFALSFGVGLRVRRVSMLPSPLELSFGIDTCIHVYGFVRVVFLGSGAEVSSICVKAGALKPFAGSIGAGLRYRYVHTFLEFWLSSPLFVPELR